MESQVSGSLYFFHAEKQWQNRDFGNFSLGTRNNLLRWQQAPDRASELGFELAVFTQFLFEDPFGNFQTNLFNVEFKVGVHYQFQRNPLLGQAGVQFIRPMGDKHWIRWMAGADIRVEQAQGFRPGIHAGAGIGLGAKGLFPITLMADYCWGYMPYSLYDHLLIQWVGASLYFSWGNPSLFIPGFTLM
ncbi:MAG: hypothetical protein D4R67_07425 [Bacteroidetes bacterium]|nr:MAG: hypothetical protein D4R67_07425 [Bacteroidota bacterium]